jgi:hypothetical protein
MKLYSILLCTLAVLIVACEKSNNDTTPSEPLKQLKYTLSSKGDSTAFEYNTDHSIRQVFTQNNWGIVTLLPSYDAEGKMTKITEPNANRITQIFTHNSTSQLLESFYYSGLASDNRYSFRDSVSYKNGLIDTIYMNLWYGENVHAPVYYKFYYNWDTKGNIVKMAKIDMSFPQEIHTTTYIYTYDDKANPYHQIKDYYFFNFLEEELPMKLSANNILTISSSDDVTTYRASQNNMYTYDNAGNPVTMTSTLSARYADGSTSNDTTFLKLAYDK